MLLSIVFLIIAVFFLLLFYMSEKESIEMKGISFFFASLSLFTFILFILETINENKNRGKLTVQKYYENKVINENEKKLLLKKEELKIVIEKINQKYNESAAILKKSLIELENSNEMKEIIRKIENYNQKPEAGLNVINNGTLTINLYENKTLDCEKDGDKLICKER